MTALCLFSALVMAIESTAAVAAFARGTVGHLGVKGLRTTHGGFNAIEVRGFEPWSQAPQAGVRAADVLRFDHWYDRGRRFHPGETVGFTIVRGGEVLAARIVAAERSIEVRERWHFAMNAVLCGLGTLLGWLIGFRQADARTSRALAMAFLWWSANLGRGYAPAEWPAALVSFVQDLALLPGWYLGLWFAIHYPDEQPHGLRRVLKRALPLFLVALVLAQVVVAAQTLGLLAPNWFWWATTPYVGVAGALMVVAFLAGWWRSSGEPRQRFSWLLGSFGLMWTVSYLTWMDEFFADSVAAWLGLVSVLGSLLALIGLSYAILRHRVLDMGLALNRSLVFTVVGAVLLGGFHFLNVLAGRLLHFDDPAKAGLLSAVLAALVVLAYPKVKPRAEWLVDRLFFQPWVARESELASFTTDARGYTEAATLGQALIGAADRFTGEAGAALYVREGNGSFARQPGATLEAPELVPADEPMAVALRAGRTVVGREAVHSALPAQLAFVVSRPRELEAFVLIGPRRDGRALRQDEVAALRDALQAIGQEWHALRWLAWQRDASARQDAVT